PSDEILSEENAHFFATEDQPVGGWAENVEYYYENSVWTLICDNISGKDWMHGLLDEEPLTVDAAVEFAKESKYSLRFTAEYTEDGWIRNDSYDNEIINEKLLANGYFEAATYRGYNMHSELGKSTEALEYLKRVYEAGGDSSFEIGHIYHDLGNLEQAITWMEEAAKAGHANGAVNVGVYYTEKADTAKAIEWFQKAYEMGASVGALYAGYAYEDRGDFDHTVEWLEKAYEAGNVNGALYLGVIFDKGFNCEVDYEKAFDWFMKAADMGDAYAANHIGAYYNEGCYVEKDTAKANEWYQKAFDGFMKAADMGNAAAAHNIGVYYNIGRYVEKDTAKANEWFHKAEDMGYTG
ncbi:MAG: tetratricopeptide repeat protein, partial [bacterium]|nr:tetratricopeptide repeat protein [bacterium]